MEEYWRMSDSLCEIRWLNAKKQLDLYERVISIDSANAEDRVMQVAVWKGGYESFKGESDKWMKAFEKMSEEKNKQERRKRIWRTVALAGIPLSFMGGIIFVVVQ